MARGGARPGAGRPAGSGDLKKAKMVATERARIIAEAALNKESTPLSVMLEAMEFFVAEARRVRATPEGVEVKVEPASDGGTPKVHVLTTHSLYVQASEMAKKAAPYVHPALASTEVKVNRGFEEAVLSVDEALRRAAEEAEGSPQVH